jgi:general secretion pathway protein M
MTIKPGTVQSRALALLLAALVLAGLFELAVAPLWSAYRARQAEAEQLALELRSYGRLAASEDHLRRLTQQVREQLVAEQLHLGGSSTALAGAELQQRFDAVASRAGATLLSTQVLPPDREGEMERVTARVHMRTSVEALPAVLHAIESGFPYLYVDEVRVMSRRARTTAAKVVRAAPVDLSLQVSGYLRPDEPGETPQG